MMRTAITVERLLATQTGAAMLAELAAETLEERERLADELRAVESSRLQGGKPFADKHARICAERDAAKKAYENAVLAEMQAAGEWSNYTDSIERAVARLHNRLRETADPRIDDMIRWIDAQTAQWRNLGAATSFNFDRQAAARETAQINQRRAAVLETLRAARAEVESMKLLALAPAELLGRLAKIQSGIPSAHGDQGAA